MISEHKGLLSNSLTIFFVSFFIISTVFTSAFSAQDVFRVLTDFVFKMRFQHSSKQRALQRTKGIITDKNNEVKNTPKQTHHTQRYAAGIRVSRDSEGVFAYNGSIQVKVRKKLDFSVTIVTYVTVRSLTPNSLTYLWCSHALLFESHFCLTEPYCLLSILQTIEFDEGAGAVLRIQPLRAPRDENIYECVAENSEGEITVNARLSIIRGESRIVKQRAGG